jgi:hypothetical protein
MENPREIIDDKYQAFIDNDSINMNYTKLEYVYKSYIGLLDKIDASVCDYRDKFIEHSDSLSTPMLNTGPCSLRLVHMESNAFGRPRSTEEQLKANNLFLTSQDMFLLRTEHGTHCYVHVSPYYTTGADVFSGDEIGGIYDGTKLHFKKYGAHTHYFPPLNDDLENEFSMPVHIHQICESPDILHSIDLITIFTFTALDSFMTYKTNQ